MLSRYIHLIPVSLVFAFGLIAFVFSVLAVTSKSWALRHNYIPSLSDLDWAKSTVVYTRYRSPFKICQGTLIPTNDTTAVPRYRQNCTSYAIYGLGKTSCEVANATQSDAAKNIGDARICQQIHYAGNFGIASSVFMGLGFVSILAMVAFTLLGSKSDTTHSTSEENDGKRISSTGQISSTTTRTPPTRSRRRSTAMAYVNLLLVVFLAIATITTIISQYYGILGFIQSLPNNSDFASSKGQDSTDEQTHGDHGPWIQGKALSVYLTCAWGFAVATGVLASRIWALPEWGIHG
jgi:hypothetical protein